MSEEEVNAMIKKDEEEMRKNDPEFYARLQEIKRRSAEKAKRKPVIPIYKLGY